MNSKELTELGNATRDLARSILNMSNVLMIEWTSEQNTTKKVSSITILTLNSAKDHSVGNSIHC
jgi:hypothetical protein